VDKWLAEPEPSFYKRYTTGGPELDIMQYYQGACQRVRRQLPVYCCLAFPSHQMSPMGCFSSKPVQVDLPSAAATTGREVTRRQSSTVTQPVVRRSSQHSRANAGHDSPTVEEVSVRERPRSKSTSHQRPPVGFGEDLPPVPPPHRIRAKSTHASSSRSTSTPVVPGEYYRRWSAQYQPH
jgi:hypothetical protein